MRIFSCILLSIIGFVLVKGQDSNALDPSSFNFNFNTFDSTKNDPTNNKNSFGAGSISDQMGLADPPSMKLPFGNQGSNSINFPDAAPQPANTFGQPSNTFGQSQNSFGQPPNPFGQPPNSIGQPPNSIGQPPNSIGQSANPFVQPQNTFAQPQPMDSFGQPQNSFGQPPNSIGQPPNSIGQPPNSIGQLPNSIGQPSNTFGQPSNTFGQPQGNARGDLSQSGAMPAAQTPEERWLAVGGSQLPPQNSNPNLSGNINAGMPFNTLGFDRNNVNQFRPMNPGGQFDRRFNQGSFPNSNQMPRRFQNQPPQRGFPNQGQRQMDMSRQFEAFGTTGNDLMTFNEEAIGPGPTSELESFNPANPANQQEQNNQVNQPPFGRPPFGGGPPFGDGPPFPRPPMGFGGFMGPRPAMGINGFQPMGRFPGAFMPRPMIGAPMMG